jgi:thiol-disulfide isomerase/thioredoxin
MPSLSWVMWPKNIVNWYNNMKTEDGTKSTQCACVDSPLREICMDAHNYYTSIMSKKISSDEEFYGHLHKISQFHQKAILLNAESIDELRKKPDPTSIVLSRNAIYLNLIFKMVDKMDALYGEMPTSKVQSGGEGESDIRNDLNDMEVSKPTLILFMGTWCGPSMKFINNHWDKVVSHISEKHPDVQIIVKKCERNSDGQMDPTDLELLSTYRVDSFPTIVMTRDKTYATTGAGNADAVINFVDLRMKSQKGGCNCGAKLTGGECSCNYQWN